MSFQSPLHLTILGRGGDVIGIISPRRALAHELGKTGLRVERERSIAVYYDGIEVGDFSADMLVEDRVMLELKANQALVPVNEVQLVNYLTASLRGFELNSVVAPLSSSLVVGRV